MGGHNRSRSVGHKNSGLSFGHVNWDTIIKFKNITYFEDCWFIDVVKNKILINYSRRNSLRCL